MRRLRPGELIDVTDGLGRGLECEVVAVRRDEVDCVVRRRLTEAPARPRLVVAQALAKGDRGERAVETLTEVGVDEIVPWAAARSVVRWDGDRGARAQERWARTAEEASKQSHRLVWPRVGPLAGIREMTERVRAATLAVVLHEQATTPLVGLVRPQALLAVPAVPAASVVPASQAGRSAEPELADPAAPSPTGSEILLVVGPEGGIAESELTALQAAGAAVARLGPTVLRTSTAGTVAAAVVLADLGRWGGPAR